MTSTSTTTAKGQARHPYFSTSDIHDKRVKREASLSGLSSVEPLLARFADAQTFSRECPGCHDAKSNNRLYCYKCMVPVGGLVLPQVKLPIKLDIVRHVKESRTKSTALHAKLLGEPGMVRVVETPDVDSLGAFDPATTLLLYPTKDSVTLEDMTEAELRRIDRVVVVDSTWHQAASVLRLPQLASLTRRVKLARDYSTSFWRYQQKGDEYLATIEAIHFFFREYDAATNAAGTEYDGKFDNLLYIFMGMLQLIESKKHQAVSE
jgi:DTW domain-containing protein YfiP